MAYSMCGLTKLLYNIRNVSFSMFLNCRLIIPKIFVAFFANCNWQQGTIKAIAKCHLCSSKPNLVNVDRTVIFLIKMLGDEQKAPSLDTEGVYSETLKPSRGWRIGRGYPPGERRKLPQRGPERTQTQIWLQLWGGCIASAEGGSVLCGMGSSRLEGLGERHELQSFG